MRFTDHQVSRLPPDQEVWCHAYFFFPSQQPPQQSQHFKNEKQLQQHDIPQQAHRIMHQTIEKTIKPPTIIAAITGHLLAVSLSA
jgi:hypothetical protein